MAEFHCKGCRSDICEYCFSFKENLCEECSRNGPRCGVCRESSFLTKGIECQFCKTYYCTRHSAGQDDYRRFGFVQGPCCLACLRDETRRRRDPEGNRAKNRSPGGAPGGRSHRLCGHPLTDSVTLQLGINPMRLIFRVLQRLRNPCPWISVKPVIIQDLIPTVQGRRILRALNRRPCVAPILLTRNVGCVIGIFPTPAKSGNVRYA